MPQIVLLGRIDWHNIGCDPLLTGRSGSHEHPALPDSRQLANDAFDLTRFYSMPVDLHLIIEAPEIVDQPVDPPHDAVTGAITTSRRAVCRGNFNEAFARERRLVQIAQS